MTDGQNTRDQITRDRRSKRAWSKCVLCVPYNNHSQWKSKLMLATYLRRMRNNNLGLWAPPVACNYFHIQHDWKNWHISYIFKIFFLMSTSFSTIRSSNCWILKSFRLRAVLHSGHAADGRVKRVSTQLSHLAEQNVGQNYLSGNSDNGNKQKKHMKKDASERNYQIFWDLYTFSRAYFYLRIVLPPVTYGLCLMGFLQKNPLKGAGKESCSCCQEYLIS